MIARELIHVAKMLIEADEKTAFTHKIMEMLRILKAEGIKIRTVTEEPVAAIIEFINRDNAWFGINILKEEGFSVEIAGPTSISVATL